MVLANFFQLTTLPPNITSETPNSTTFTFAKPVFIFAIAASIESAIFL